MTVNQSTGSILATDTTTNTFDANQDPASSSDAATGSAVGSDSTQPVTTNTTDDAGRVISSKTTVAGTTVSEIDTIFDGDGNATFITSKVLNADGSTYRTTYTGNWYDADGNLQTSVNYGTNGGTSMSSRPGSPPGRSTTPGTPEVTSYTYTGEGYVASVTDPRNITTTKQYDEQGNVTQTVSDSTGIAQTTNFTYNSDNQILTQTAVNPAGVNQTTQYNYGPSGPNQDKGLLLSIYYPDPSTGAASSSQQVTYTYNSGGQVATMTDRDGTVHAYEYDDAGEQIADVITKLGAGVDGTVMERDTGYNDQGQPATFTTKNADGVVLSQVGETYDGNGEVVAEAQSHSGVVGTGTPTVGYGFQETAGGQGHQTSLI